MTAEKKIFFWFAAIFLLFWFLPVDNLRLQGAILEAFALTHWYAKEHVILCQLA